MMGLHDALKPMRRRMKLQRTVEWGFIGLFIGLAAVLLLRGASFLWPIRRTAIWSLGALTAAPLVCMLVSWLWPVSAMDAARKVDAHGLQARTQTALMLDGSETPMAALQRQDALRCLTQADEKLIFPLKVPKGILIGIAACIALLGLSFLIPNGQTQVLAAREAYLREMTQQADKLDEGAASLRAEDPQTPELRKLLSDLSLALRKADTPAAALTAVDDAERRITAMQQSTGKSALSSLSKSGLDDLAKTMQAEDEQAMKQLLEQLGSQNAADGLNAAAREAGDPAASQMLTAAAQALEDGNTALAMSQLTAAAAGESSGTVQAAALSQMVRLAAASAGTKQAAALAAAGVSSQAFGTGQSASGQGSGGQGMGSGSGAGEGSSNQDAGYRSTSQSAVSTGNRDPQWKIEEYEAIYDPTRQELDGSTVSPGGQTGEGEWTESYAGTGLGTADESVPYDRVLAQYEQSQVQAVQNADLPAYAKQWVQDYFGALAE